MTSPAAAPANDKTGSIFISKDKFGAAAREVGLDAAVGDALWAKLCESSGQRIIAGKARALFAFGWRTVQG